MGFVHASANGDSGPEKLFKAIDGLLVEDDLVTEPMGPRIDLATSRVREQVVQLDGRGDVIGMRLG